MRAARGPEEIRSDGRVPVRAQVPVGETSREPSTQVGAPSVVVRQRNILVRAPNWTGDLVMATPGFRALRAGFPAASITLHVRESMVPLLAGAPWFDEVLPLTSYHRGPAALLRAKGVIRKFTRTRARELLQEALELEDAAAIRALLNAELDEVGLGGLIRAGK